MVEREKLRLPIPISPADHAAGPDIAAVTVVKYGDYECPDCQRNHRAIEKVFNELIERVRFVYRHFPLINTHPHALRAAEAAEVAAAQGKFWEMNRELYLNPGRLSDHDLRKHAVRVGLEMTRYDREMEDHAYTEQITKGYYQSLMLGISGTPTIFVNDVLCARTGTELVETVRALADAPAVEAKVPRPGREIEW